MEAFSINDFPPEIIEKFAPDLKPKTISNLKLVSKRFYSVFSNDRFFKCYLFHPEQNYLCEMKSECKAHGVREVVDDMKNGEVGRWKGYLRLEKVHADNWRRGRFDTFDELPFPPHVDISSTGTNMTFEELIDDENEHWLLCTVPFIVFLFNITAKPKLVATLDTTVYIWHTHNLKQLLPGQVIVQIDEIGRYDVYRIVRNGNDHDLQHQYFLEDSAEKCSSHRVLPREPEPYVATRYAEILTSGRDERTGHSRTIFVGYSMQYPFELQIWDLKTGLKMAKVTMGEHEIWKDYLLAHNNANIWIYEGEFPNIIVNLDDHPSVQISIFDVFKMEVTLVDEVRVEDDYADKSCYMYLNYLCVTFDNALLLYVIESSRDEDGSSKHAKLLFRPTGTGLQPVLSFENHKMVLCYDIKVDKTDRLAVQVLNLDGVKVVEQSFSLVDFNRDDAITFVHPNMLVMFKDISQIKVLDTNGNELCSCEDLDPLNMTWLKEWSTTTMIAYATQDFKSVRLYHF